MKKISVLWATFMIIGLLAACVAPAPTTLPAPAPGAPTATQGEAPAPAAAAAPAGGLITVNVNLGNEPQSVDPGVGGDFNSSSIHDQLFLGLVGLDPKTTEITPQLATKWEVSDDGLTWTFHMRNDIPWVRYDPATKKVEKLRNVTAQDVEYAVKRVAMPETAANWAYLLYHIIDKLYEVNTGVQGVTKDDVGVKALDDTTVQFKLERPTGFFLYVIAMMTTRPVPKEPVEQYGDKWVEPGNIWTTGPWVLTEWQHNNRMALEKNPYYFDADKIQVQRVEIAMITEVATVLSLYETNKLDTITGLPADQIDRVKNDPVLGKELTIRPSLGVSKLEFVNTKPPFDDVRVRQAFSAAIDRKTLVENVTKGGEIPATTYAPPGVFGAVPPEAKIGQGYDPALAKAKLDEFLKEKGMTIDQFNQTYKITYGTTCTDASRRVQQAIAAMFKQVLGVETDLQCLEGNAYTQTIKKETPVEQTFHIHSAGWNVDYPDQSNFVSWYHCEGENFARRGCADANCKTCKDTEFDKVIEQADSSSNAEERKKLYARAEEILFGEEFAWAPLYWRTSLILTKPWLTRDFPPMGRPNFKAWTVDWAAKQAATK